MIGKLNVYFNVFGTLIDEYSQNFIDRNIKILKEYQNDGHNVSAIAKNVDEGNQHKLEQIKSLQDEFGISTIFSKNDYKADTLIDNSVDIFFDNDIREVLLFNQKSKNGKGVLVNNEGIVNSYVDLFENVYQSSYNEDDYEDYNARINNDIKPTEDVVACVVDSGYFISLARKLSKKFKKVYYSSPTDEEFLSINDFSMGEGFPEIKKIEGYGFMRPEILKEIDLFIFSDIGYSPIQNYLRSIGKSVWGSFDATKLEIMRSDFLKELKKIGLPTAYYKTCYGLTELISHLKTVTNKYIKVDRYRNEMETWHHIDFDHSKRKLEDLAIKFGGVQDNIVFIVQNEIPTSMETGCDAWTIDGMYPKQFFQGYEKKNELYIASLLDADDMPKPVTQVNKALSKVFKKYGYRNFFATEIRVGNDGKNYFIDPTFRLPGMSGEQLLESCSNLNEVIWYGANGVLLEPVYKYKYICTASAHYCGEGGEDGWSVIKIPNEIEQWVKFSHCCKVDGLYHFPKKQCDLGIVMGCGNTLLDALSMLKKNIDWFKKEPVSFKLNGFFDLLKSIRSADKKGIKFSNDAIPSDEEVLKIIEK